MFNNFTSEEDEGEGFDPLETYSPEWGVWSEVGACSTTCGPGTFSYTRTCSNPEPIDDIKTCFGDASKTEPCANDPCPGKYNTY